jgi:hypothetical protein
MPGSKGQHRGWPLLRLDEPNELLIGDTPPDTVEWIVAETPAAAIRWIVAKQPVAQGQWLIASHNDRNRRRGLDRHHQRQCNQQQCR